MRLTELREQQPRHRVIRHADADGAAFLVLQAPRRLARRGQQERIRPGRRGLEHAELPGFHPRVTRDLGQVAAHQREMMMPVGGADAADAIQRILVADVAAERVTGIRRIDDHPAVAHDLRGTANQSQLRILGMKLEILAHGRGCALAGHGAARAAIIRAALTIRQLACNVSLSNSLPGSSSARLQVAGGILSRHRRAHGRHVLLLAYGLAAHPQGAADAPGAAPSWCGCSAPRR